MDAKNKDEAFLQLLQTIAATPRDRGPAAGVEVPPQDWTVGGEQVPDDDRAEIVQSAADRRFITITDVAGYPFPTSITSEGHQFLREWGRTIPRSPATD